MPLIEEAHYSDNHFTIDNGIVDIDRIYMIDEYKFTQNNYKKLDLIYKQLPDFKGYDERPNWFGLDGDEYSLTISFEPSGLQLMGNLKKDDYERWVEKFHDLMEGANFPYKYA